MRTNDLQSNTSEYWMEIIKSELPQQVRKQLQLAQELGVTKSFIGQVLK